MAYKHLKDFLEQTVQKVFWIFTYGNLAGLVGGFLVARWLSGLLPGVPGLLLFGLGLGAGLALTWRLEGQALGARGLRWVAWQGRRLTAPGSRVVRSRAYYARPPAGVRSFTLDGLVVYQGERAHAGGWRPPPPVPPIQGALAHGSAPEPRPAPAANPDSYASALPTTTPP